MDDDLRESLTATETWIRGLYMILFAFIYSLAEVVVVAVVVFQFLWMLITRSTNERLLEFSDDLSVFIYQILQFVTFNTEEKPFPFAPWPYGLGGPDAGTVEEDPVMISESNEITEPEDSSPEDRQ